MDQYLLEDILEQKRFTRLMSVNIYSVEDGEKVNRARLTKVTSQYYLIGMADHNRKWSPNPFQGTMEEMVNLLVNDFGFVLMRW